MVVRPGQAVDEKLERLKEMGFEAGAYTRPHSSST